MFFETSNEWFCKEERSTIDSWKLTNTWKLRLSLEVSVLAILDKAVEANENLGRL